MPPTPRPRMLMSAVLGVALVAAIRVLWQSGDLLRVETPRLDDRVATIPPTTATPPPTSPRKLPLANIIEIPGLELTSRVERRPFELSEDDDLEGGKYMVFHTEGGLMSQRRHFILALHLGAILNRTLLVPMVRGHLERRVAKLPADMVFDFDHVNNNFGISASSPRHRLNAIPYDYPDRVGEKLPEFMRRAARDKSSNVVVEINTHVDKSRGLDHLREIAEITRRYKILVAHKNFITSVPYPRVKTFHNVRFSPSLRRIALEVWRRDFGDENYDAIQIRWGDMLNVRGFKRIEGPYLAAGAKLGMGDGDGGVVYVATEETNRTYFANLISRFNVRFASDLGGSPTLEPLRAAAKAYHPGVYFELLAAVDSLLCLCSRAYVATTASHYSMIPVEIRTGETGFPLSDHFPECVERWKARVGGDEVLRRMGERSIGVNSY